MSRYRGSLMMLAGILALLVVAGACAGGDGETAAPAPPQPAAAPPVAAAPVPAAPAPAPEMTAPQPQRGGALIFGNGKAVRSPHPYTTTSSVDKFIKETFLEPLTKLDAAGRLEGLLAESWEANADATQWTFKLRQGVKFHNGQELTAEDVVWSTNYILDPENASRGQSVMAGEIEKVEARVAQMGKRKGR